MLLMLFLRKYFLVLLVLIITILNQSCKSTEEFGNRTLRQPSTASDYVYVSKSNTKNTSTKKTRKSSDSTHKTKSESKISTSYQNQQEIIIDEAQSYIGTPYNYNGKTPKPGFDCSGFVAWVFSKAGYNLSGSSQTQSSMGKPIGKDELDRGDLVFFGQNGKVTHVSIVDEVKANHIYVIHATSSRGVVKDEITNNEYWDSRFLFARRVITDNDVVRN